MNSLGGSSRLSAVSFRTQESGGKISQKQRVIPLKSTETDQTGQVVTYDLQQTFQLEIIRMSTNGNSNFRVQNLIEGYARLFLIVSVILAIALCFPIQVVGQDNDGDANKIVIASEIAPVRKNPPKNLFGIPYLNIPGEKIGNTTKSNTYEILEYATLPHSFNNKQTWVKIKPVENSDIDVGWTYWGENIHLESANFKFNDNNSSLHQ